MSFLEKIGNAINSRYIKDFSGIKASERKYENNIHLSSKEETEKQDVSPLENALDNAKGKVNTAQNSVDSAQNSVDNTQNALNSIGSRPEAKTITNPDGTTTVDDSAGQAYDAQKAILEGNLNNAKAILEKSQEDLRAAQEEEANAQDALDKAEEENKEIEDALEEANNQNEESELPDMPDDEYKAEPWDYDPGFMKHIQEPWNYDPGFTPSIKPFEPPTFDPDFMPSIPGLNPNKPIPAPISGKPLPNIPDDIKDIISKNPDGISNPSDNPKATTMPWINDEIYNIVHSRKLEDAKEIEKYGFTDADMEGKEVYITQTQYGQTVVEFRDENGKTVAGYCFEEMTSNGDMTPPWEKSCGHIKYTEYIFDETGNPIGAVRYQAETDLDGNITSGGPKDSGNREPLNDDMTILERWQDIAPKHPNIDDFNTGDFNIDDFREQIRNRKENPDNSTSPIELPNDIEDKIKDIIGKPIEDLDLPDEIKDELNELLRRANLDENLKNELSDDALNELEILIEQGSKEAIRYFLNKYI